MGTQQQESKVVQMPLLCRNPLALGAPMKAKQRERKRAGLWCAGTRKEDVEAAQGGATGSLRKLWPRQRLEEEEKRPTITESKTTGNFTSQGEENNLHLLLPW